MHVPACPFFQLILLVPHFSINFSSAFLWPLKFVLSSLQCTYFQYIFCTYAQNDTNFVQNESYSVDFCVGCPAILAPIGCNIRRCPPQHHTPMHSRIPSSPPRLLTCRSSRFIQLTNKVNCTAFPHSGNVDVVNHPIWSLSLWSPLLSFSWLPHCRPSFAHLSSWCIFLPSLSNFPS